MNNRVFFARQSDEKSNNYNVARADPTISQTFFPRKEHKLPHGGTATRGARRKVGWKEGRKVERKETQRAPAEAILWNPAILSGVFGDDICSDQSIRSPWQPVSLVCPPPTAEVWKAGRPNEWANVPGGVRYWWLVVRRNPRRAGSRSWYTFLTHRWSRCVLVPSMTNGRYKGSHARSFYVQFSILARYLHIRATKSQHGQRIHEARPRNCPRSSSRPPSRLPFALFVQETAGFACFGNDSNRKKSQKCTKIVWKFLGIDYWWRCRDIVMAMNCIWNFHPFKKYTDNFKTTR